MGWLAMLSCAPLIFSLAHPPLPVLVLLWALAGAGGAYQLAAAAAFVTALPAARRVRAFAVAETGLLAAQGLGVLTGGAVAQRLGPPAATALAGLVGLPAAAALATDWTRRHPELISMLDNGRAAATLAGTGPAPASLVPASPAAASPAPSAPQRAARPSPEPRPAEPGTRPARAPVLNLTTGDRAARTRLAATRLLDQVLGDRRALPFLWDDDPRRQIHQGADAEGHHGQGDEDQPDHGGVDTDVLSDPGADASHEPTFPCPD